jgi:hypothetical protein
MPDRELTPRLAAAVLAGYLGHAVNPGLTREDAPVAAALLNPLARRTVEMWARDGYRLVKTARESHETPAVPSLTLLSGGQSCHNGPEFDPAS